jgi:hypothetical protein
MGKLSLRNIRNYLFPKMLGIFSNEKFSLKLKHFPLTIVLSGPHPAPPLSGITFFLLLGAVITRYVTRCAVNIPIARKCHIQYIYLMLPDEEEALLVCYVGYLWCLRTVLG